jgi:prolycopene isomerase
MDKYEVIIIGSGIGGLTAGVLLARNGKKVLVLEKNDKPGGYAVNFKKEKFEFDASLHMICGCGEAGNTYAILNKCGVTDKVKFIKTDCLYRSIFPDFDFRVPQNNPQEYLNYLIKEFPSEETGIKKLFNEMAKIYFEMEKFFSSDTPRGLELLFFPIKYPKLIHYVKKPLQNLLNKYLRDYRLKAIISQLWGYYGLPPSQLSSLYFVYPWYDYLYNGGFYPEGGSQALSNAFVEVIKENNGNVILNKEIEKIIIEDGCGKGVRTKDGEEIFSEVIISNIDANKTFHDLIGLEYLKNGFKKRIKKMQPSISALQIYLGLGVNLKEKEVLDYEIFYNHSYDLNRQYKDWVTNENIEKMLYAITVYSNIQPKICPSGKSVVGIIALAGYDYWAKLNKKEYKEKKQRAANILIKEAEKVIPHLSSYIEEIDIATPLTMEKYTGNYKGAIYGWSQIIPQCGFKRMNSQTPIKNVYLSSAWTQPGGGIAGVIFAGNFVAREIIKRLSP